MKRFVSVTDGRLLAISAVLIGIGSFFAMMAPIRAMGTTRVELHMAIDSDLKRVRGEANLRFTNSSREALPYAELWLFPERLKTPPKGMGEVEKEWMFPHGFSQGAMRLESVKDASGRELPITYPSPTLARVTLHELHRTGEEIELNVTFETTIPSRYGPFGRVGTQVTLDGGFFPRPPPFDRTGYRADFPPEKLFYRVNLRGETEGLYAGINGDIRRLNATQRWSNEGSKGPVAERISLVLSRHLWVTRLDTRSGSIELYHSKPRARDVSDGEIPDLMAVDRQGQIVSTVGLLCGFLSTHPNVVVPKKITMFEVPLRRDLALDAPGMVLISDRAFEMPPMERLRRLHRVAILRSVVAQIVKGKVASAQSIGWRDRAVDLVALELVSRWESAHYGERYDLTRALAGGSFVAQIDEVLYAPQIPLQQVYFRPVDDTDRHRDRFTLFSHDHPTGQRLYSKLQDRSAEGSVLNLVGLLLEGMAFEEAYQRSFNDTTRELLSQWDGAYPQVNYRLARSQRGRDSEGYFVDVVVVKEGGHNIVEPVVVGAWDQDDRFFEETWDGRGSEGIVRIRSSSPLARVQIDPHHRLLEASKSRTMPREDNQDYEPWKFLVRGLSAGFASSGNRLNIALLSTIKPMFSSNHSIHLEPFESGHGTGLVASYFRHFGSFIRPNLRANFAGLSLAGEWRRQSDYWDAGMRGSIALIAGGSTYVSRVNPTSGTRWSVSASLKLTAADESHYALRLLADFAHVVPIADGHVFALRFSAGTAVGDLTEDNRWRLGGTGRVRAFGLLDQTGTHRLMGGLEWRHRLLGGLHVNLAQLAWLKSLHGVLFLDTASLANDFTSLHQSTSFFAGVGYGLRFTYDIFGLYPAVLALDISVPVYTGRKLNTESTYPLSVVVTAGQSF